MSTSNIITENKIDSFTWDESVQEMDFFGENTPAPVVEKEEEESEEEKEESNPEGKTKTKEKSVFEGFETEEEEEESEEQEEEEEENEEDGSTDKTKVKEVAEVNTNKGVLTFLKDKGLVDFELEEGKELSEEEAEDLLAEKFEESIESRLGESLQSLPESVKALVKFAINGGDADNMIAQMAKSSVSGLSSDLDIEEEANQISVMKHQLTKEGYDAEYIESNIEFLKDTGKLKAISKVQFEKWKKEEGKAIELQVESQKEAKIKAKQNQIQYRKDITKHLSETESINNLKFNKKDLKDLPDYIGTPSVKLANGREITPMMLDIQNALKDNDKVLLLAKLLKSGFDFKEVEKEITTKEALKLKNNIQRQKETKSVNSVKGGSKAPKRLADYF